MRNIPGHRSWGLLLLAFAVTTLALKSAQAQSAAGNTEQEPQAAAQQSAPPQDPLAQIQFTPEQRQKIRAIRTQNEAERTAIRRRISDAQLALDEALDADNPSEELIERRVRELGEAQTALIRMRSLSEIRIRRVLTPEQLTLLRRLRSEAKARQEQRLENQGNRRGNPNGLPNRRNGMEPLSPQQQRRDGLPRRPRP
jgi:Spy/CpxP family protein refolding chaperone